MTERLVQTLSVLATMMVGYRLIAVIGRRGLRRLIAHSGAAADAERRAETLWAVARRLILVVVTVSTLLVVAGIWGISTTPLIAFGSTIGVALGLGAQSLVKDVIAGFLILAEDQYRIGDTIHINDVSGEVVDIRPRVTVLRDAEGAVHYVPNGSIVVASNRSGGR
jgi:small conductance mechanosensitive channel